MSEPTSLMFCRAPAALQIRTRPAPAGSVSCRRRAPRAAQLRSRYAAPRAPDAEGDG
jgi:hypothetical protein